MTVIDPMHPLVTIERLPAEVLDIARRMPTTIDDTIVGIVVVALLWGALWLAFAGESGSHRAGFLVPSRPTGEHRWSHVFTSPHAHTLARAIEREQPTQPVATTVIVHHDADTFHPLAEVAAVDNDDAQWIAYLADARLEHQRERQRIDDEFAWAADWGDGMAQAVATADAWHAEHGRHCACCHVGIGDGEQSIIWAEWRTGESTIEIPVAQLIAAGAR